MTDLTYFFSRDDGSNERTRTGTTETEETAYTVSWASLTGAGFANADEVLIVTTVGVGCSSLSGSSRYRARKGSTFAGSTALGGSYDDGEASQDFWVRRCPLFFTKVTLATNDNLYFATATSTGTALFINHTVLVVKLSDLGASNYVYAENNPNSSPASYDTNGASVSIPTTGDWLIFSGNHWLINNTTDDIYTAIYDGTNDYSEVSAEGENITNEYNQATIAYRAGLSSGTTVYSRFKCDSGGTAHVCDRTSIFCVRLNAFEDHWGAHTTNTITHSSISVNQTYASNSSYSKTSTGPFMFVSCPIHTITANTNAFNATQHIDGAAWPADGLYWLESGENGASQKITQILLGCAASLSSGTKNLEALAHSVVGTGYSCTEQIAAAFSLTLAITGSTERLAPDSVAASTNLTNTGTISYIQDDPDSPDANWFTATSATSATDVRVTFPTPSGDPIGTQNFRAYLRKTTGAPTPTADVMLYQGGSLVATLLDDRAITSTSGQVIQGNWNAGQLSGTLDGSDVECRIVSTVGYSTTAGTLPVVNATAGGGSTSTSPFSNQVLTSPTHAVGDLLIAVCGTHNTNNNGVLTGVNGTGGTGGWNLENNSGSGWGGAQTAHVAGFGWKIAAATNEVCSVTCTGSGTDRYSARVFRIEAVDGFATTAVANIGAARTGSSASLGMPTVAAGGSNELAIALYAASLSTTVANSTAESGGDWTEPFAEYANTNLTIGVQKSDQSGGGGISGGGAAITSGVWCSVGFRVVPAQVQGDAANTVEVGAIEWNVQYEEAGAPTGVPPKMMSYMRRWRM